MKQKWPCKNTQCLREKKEKIFNLIYRLPKNVIFTFKTNFKKGTRRTELFSEIKRLLSTCNLSSSWRIFWHEVKFETSVTSLKNPTVLVFYHPFLSIVRNETNPKCFTICNFKNNAHPPNSNLHMALPDLLKSFVIKLKGQHFFKCKNKYNSP